jgi:hypothetical protein
MTDSVYEQFWQTVAAEVDAAWEDVRQKKQVLLPQYARYQQWQIFRGEYRGVLAKTLEQRRKLEADIRHLLMQLQNRQVREMAETEDTPQVGDRWEIR